MARELAAAGAVVAGVRHAQQLAERSGNDRDERQGEDDAPGDDGGATATTQLRAAGRCSQRRSCGDHFEFAASSVDEAAALETRRKGECFRKPLEVQRLLIP